MHHINMPNAHDFTPICYNTLFRNTHPQKYVEINTSKSFSKSNQKKLKLINDSKSLDKSSQITHQKRKIRPLKIKVNKQQTQDQVNQGICSIKEFKSKINKITKESNLKTPVKLSTQQTDISESIQIGRNLTNQYTCQTIGSKATLTSLTYIRDPFPTLANSLVVQEKIFNPESLLQTQNSIPSNQGSFRETPKSHQFQSIKRLINYQTPIKQGPSQKEQRGESTREMTGKKERLTLNNARNVQTHQTLKTDNGSCLSVVEENQYKKMFDNMAFPDYFSPRFRIKVSPQRSSIHTNFSLYLSNELKQ